MSISNQSESANPCTKFIKFKNGKFGYWDKEKEQTIEVPLPIKFIVLDELATVVGFHKHSDSGIYSNEVKSTQMEKLNVRAFKGGDLESGYYSEIKDAVKAQGGRYAKSVYVLLDGEMVNFQFIGAVLGAWIEKDFKSPEVKIEKTIEETNGAVTYRKPIFEQWDGGDIELAKELDKTLQEYLTPYLQKNVGDEVATAEELKATAEDFSELLGDDNKPSVADDHY